MIAFIRRLFRRCDHEWVSAIWHAHDGVCGYSVAGERCSRCGKKRNGRITEIRWPRK